MNLIFINRPVASRELPKGCTHLEEAEERKIIQIIMYINIMIIIINTVNYNASERKSKLLVKIQTQVALLS